MYHTCYDDARVDLLEERAIEPLSKVPQQEREVVKAVRRVLNQLQLKRLDDQLQHVMLEDLCSSGNAFRAKVACNEQALI